MKWRNVTYAEHVGYGARFEDGYSRNVFACHLECGHCSLVTARDAPFKLDCMRCGDAPVQVMLPMPLPPILKRGKGLFP